VEGSVAPGVDQCSAQKCAAHVARGPREVSDDEGYRSFYPRLLGIVMALD
jgi:hypothetical protein